MKISTSLCLAAASLSLLGSVSAAQTGPAPSITSVPDRKASAPGNVSIFGSHLGLVTRVEVNGVPTPILAVSATRVRVGPVAPLDPGFGTVEVIAGRERDSAPIEFLPTLAAVRRGARLSLTLNNGEPGTYVLRYSYQAFGPVLDPGIWGPRWLGSNASVLAAGVFPDSDPVQVTGLRMPIVIGQLGAPLRLQAECFGSTSSTTAYTNLALVPGFGDPSSTTPP